jgi:hypoxanthine phosphoribosyltransferase
LLLIYKLYCLITNINLIYYSSWNNIENIIKNIKIQNKYDIVIGIKSGGAYISNYVAKINDIPNVGYIKIKKIKQENENNGIYSRFNQSLYNNMYKLKSFYSPIDLRNKRVLIVDDGLLSGKTFHQVKKFIKTKNPKKYHYFC